MIENRTIITSEYSTNKQTKKTFEEEYTAYKGTVNIY